MLRFEGTFTQNSMFFFAGVVLFIQQDCLDVSWGGLPSLQH